MMRGAPRWLATSLFALAGSACDEPRHGQTSRDEPPPVVQVQPVETRPFEEGYAIGFWLGMAAAVPRAKLPEQGEVEAHAEEAAGSEPGQPEKWAAGLGGGLSRGISTPVHGQKMTIFSINPRTLFLLRCHPAPARPDRWRAGRGWRSGGARSARSGSPRCIAMCSAATTLLSRRCSSRCKKMRTWSRRCSSAPNASGPRVKARSRHNISPPSRSRCVRSRSRRSRRCRSFPRISSRKPSPAFLS